MKMSVRTLAVSGAAVCLAAGLGACGAHQPTAVRVSPGAASTTSTTSAPECPASAVTATSHLLGETSSETWFQLRLTNSSASSCALTGVPHVTFASSSGQPPVSEREVSLSGASIASPQPTTVNLAHGATATVSVGLAACPSSMTGSPYTMNLTLSDTQRFAVPWNLGSGCASGVTVQVTPVAAGMATEAPGFSSDGSPPASLPSVNQ